MNPYRSLPSVDRVLAHPTLATADIDPALLVELVREELAGARAAIAAGQQPPDAEACAAGGPAGSTGARASAAEVTHVLSEPGVKGGRRELFSGARPHATSQHVSGTSADPGSAGPSPAPVGYTSARGSSSAPRAWAFRRRGVADRCRAGL